MEKLLKDVKKAAQKIKNTKGTIQIVTHNDADGICAGAIMANALMELNKTFQIKIIKRIKTELIDFLNNVPCELIIFLDIGAGYLDYLQNIKTDFIVADHHIVKNNINISNMIHVNPEFSNIEDITGSGVSYLIAKELTGKNNMAPIAVVGTIGDSSDSNFDIFEHPGIIRTRELKLYGRYTRPLHKAIEYASNIPGINDEAKAIQFLSELGIKMKKENGEWRTLADLSEQETKKLADAIIYEHLYHKTEFNIEEIFENVWTLKDFPKQIQDAKEFATLMNCCGRMNEGAIGIGVCLGSKKAFIESQKLVTKYRKLIRDYLKLVEGNFDIIEQSEAGTFVKAKDMIHENFIGTVVSMLFNSNSSYDPIIGLAYSEDGIKVSARSNKINISKIISKAAKKVSGISGGHCITKDSLIQLKNGEIKEIKDVKTNDNLECISLNKIKLTNARCTKKFKNSKINKIFNIKTTYGLSLKASPDHKLFTISIKNNKINLVPKKVENISIGDYIAAIKIIKPITKIQKAPDINNKIKQIGNRHYKPVNIPKQITAELAQIIGYIIGDGHIEKHKYIELRDKKLETLKYYEKLIKTVFNCNSTFSKIKDKNCWRMRTYSVLIANFIEKIISDLQVIYKSPNNVVAGFLRGLFDAEGSVHKRGNEITFSMTDKQFVKIIQLLLLRFEINSSINTHLNGTNKTKNNYITTLSIRGKNIEKFKKIGFSSLYKINNISTKNRKTSQIIPIKWIDLKKYVLNNKKINKNKIHYNRYVSY
ncbi:MAG: hypothetical protein J7K26_03210, partial [Candidatus Aenigmarchaeota archaeon]|nr:hypothetical protein [Candidatus Aenigmarchaeota archaeon]